MSFEMLAKFWLRNICDLSTEKLKKQINEQSDSIIAGLSEFRKLLSTIYTDYVSYEVDGDIMKSYHRLMDTIKFLYTVAKIGVVKNDNSTNCLNVDKLNFKESFKKPTAFVFKILPQYSFYFKYYKDGVETNSIRSCTSFDIFYNNSNELLLALNYLVKQMSNVDKKMDYATTHTLFCIADYNSILLKESTKKENISPLDYRILNTVGINKELWSKLVDKLVNQCKLTVKCNIFELYVRDYGSPTWEVSFSKGENVILSAYPKVDIIPHTEFPISNNQKKEARKLKDDLTPNVYEFLFLTTKRIRSKSIKIESEEDIESICKIIENVT